MRFESYEPEEQEAFIERFYDLFAGRLETYAIRVEGGEKPMYVPSNHEMVAKQVRKIGTEEFGPEAIRTHLLGKELIGVYPINKDSDVLFFALDFDRKDPLDPDPWQAAVDQATVLFEEGGLDVYIERSQSGNGYHVWGFLEKPVNAGRLRHAIQPLIEDVETYDRMFPNQAGVNEMRPLGNLIALPLHGGRLAQGNSAFVRRGPKGRPVPLDDQYDFIREGISLNSVELIDELFEKAGTYAPEREQSTYVGEGESVAKGWKVDHPRFGCEFVRWAHENPTEVTEPLWYALACNFAQLTDGRDRFHELSKRDEMRYDPRAVDRKYNQALEKNSPHGCETIRGLGGNCECDRRFPGEVFHPFDLAKIPFKRLVDSIGVEDAQEQMMEAQEGFARAIEWCEAVEKDPSMGGGRKYGLEPLDKLTGLRDGDLVIIAGRPAKGKASPLDSKVLTPTGWRLMGDLQVGDQVIAGDGTPTAVVGVYPQGERDVYRVVAEDGGSVECCDEHLWLTTTSKDRKAGRAGTVKQLSEIRESLYSVNSNSRGHHRIPWVEPVHFPANGTLPLDAWTLGTRFQTEGFSTIPQEYLLAPAAVRYTLLNGMLAVWRAECVTEASHPQLYEGIRFLVGSLGGWVDPTSGMPEFPRGDRGRGIVDVVHVGRKPVQCIQVAHPSHLYVAESFMVTHNTAFCGTVIDNLCMTEEPNYFFSMEMSSLQMYKRLLSTRTGVSQTRMTTGQLTKDDWTKIKSWQRIISDNIRYPVWVDDMTRSTDRMFEVAASLVHDHGKGVIWIDYLQLAQRLPRESMFEAITRIVHDLKTMAKALQCPVVALTQLNRGADEATADTQPMDSWLRGSGDIEMAADVIIFLLGESGPGVRERVLALHKERHREGGIKVIVEFNQSEMRFAPQGTWQVTQSIPDPEQSRKRAPRTADEETDDWYDVKPKSRARAAVHEDFFAGL